MGEFRPSTLYAYPDLRRIQTGFGWMQAMCPHTQLSLNAILCHYSLPPGVPARLTAKKSGESEICLMIRFKNTLCPCHPKQE
jgi:hypothetical protein